MLLYFKSHTAYLIFFTLLVVFLINLFSPQAMSQTIGSVFTIHGVKVDEVDESASKAKITALENGQKQAFLKLAERLLPYNRNLISELELTYDTSIVNPMVESFEITNEEASSTRYIANLNFYFSESKSKNYFESLSMGEVNYTPPEQTLILPIMRYSDINMGSVFWGENNLWNIEWNKYNLSNSFVPLTLPLGDLSDMQIAPEQSIIKHQLSSVKQLMRRHQTTKVIIAILEMEDMDMHNAILHIYQANNQKIKHMQTIPSISKTEKQSNIFVNAIKETVSYIESTWSYEQNNGAYSNITNNTLDSEASITANVTFANMKEWINIKKYLGNSFTILETEVVSLGRNVAQIKIKHRGNIEQLRLSLLDEGVELSMPVVALNNRFKNRVYELSLRELSPEVMY